MLTGFNAFQMTTLFAGFPFLVGWLFEGASFPGVGVAKWVAVLVYFIFFCMMTGSVYEAIEKKR